MLAVIGWCGIVLGSLSAPSQGQAPLKIGIIGSGRIGGTMGEHWVKAGHEVLFSSRHPERLRPLAERLGPKARVGTPGEAAAFGDVVFLAVPYAAIPDLGRDLAKELKGKIVVNASNPIPSRDGPLAEEAQRKGAGAADVELLPGARIARAFTSPGAGVFKSEAHRAGERIAVAVAGDDKEAVEVASRLVRDAGFEPVVVGPLSRAKDFQPGTPVFGRAMTAREMKQALRLP
ncbi:MAG TPA: NADPH-dependent F420 reductase [Methylomirabilota bacterium]